MRGTRWILLALAGALLTLSGGGGAQLPPPSIGAPASPPDTVRVPLADNDLDRMLEKLDAEEKALAKELAGIGPTIEMVKARAIARGRAHTKLARAGFLPAGGGFESLVDHAARVERLKRALERDVALEASLSRRGAELAKRLEMLRAERAPLVVQREAMIRARNALLEADERRAAFARAFESTGSLPEYLAVYGADVGPRDVDVRAGFRALEGRLSFPVSGRTEVHKVSTRGGPALELVAPAGATVRCVAPGRVAFADRVEEYGLVVVVDHGDHYDSVYGSLGSTELRAGDVVAANARIGTVGTSASGARQPHLYFEIRLRGQPIEPGPWLGL